MAGPEFFGIDMQGVFADIFTPENTMKFKLRRYTVGAYDPMNPSSGRTRTPVDFDCNGVIVNYTQDEMIEDRNIEENDSKAIVFAKSLDDLGVEPSKDDRFVDDKGRVYTVVNAKTNGLRVKWTLQLRG